MMQTTPVAEQATEILQRLLMDIKKNLEGYEAQIRSRSKRWKQWLQEQNDERIKKWHDMLESDAQCFEALMQVDNVTESMDYLENIKLMTQARVKFSLEADESRYALQKEDDVRF